MHRLRTFNEFLAKEIRNPEFRKDFFSELVNGSGDIDPLSPHQALKEVIKVIGVREFSQITKMKPPNVSRFLLSKSEPKISTLNKMLKPFGFKVKLALEAA